MYIISYRSRSPDGLLRGGFQQLDRLLGLLQDVLHLLLYVTAVCLLLLTPFSSCLVLWTLRQVHWVGLAVVLERLHRHYLLQLWGWLRLTTNLRSALLLLWGMCLLRVRVLQLMPGGRFSFTGTDWDLTKIGIILGIEHLRIGIFVLLNEPLEHKIPGWLMMPIRLTLKLPILSLLQMQRQGCLPHPAIGFKRRHVVLVPHFLQIGIIQITVLPILN